VFARYAIWLSALFLFVAGDCPRRHNHNFDGVADGTNINTTYPGVTFSLFRRGVPEFQRFCEGASALLHSAHQTWFPHCRRGSQACKDSVGGAIEVSFATPQSAVSIENFVFPAAEGLGTTGFGYFKAYDSSLNLLRK